MTIKVTVVATAPSFMPAGVPMAQGALFDGLLSLGNLGYRSTDTAFSYNSGTGIDPISSTDTATRYGPSAALVIASLFPTIGSWPFSYSSGDISSGSLIDCSYGYQSPPSQTTSNGIVDLSLIPTPIDPATLTDGYKFNISTDGSGNPTYTNCNAVFSGATFYTRALGAFNVLGLAISTGAHTGAFTNDTSDVLRSIVRVNDNDIDNPTSNFYADGLLIVYSPTDAYYLSISSALSTNLTWPQKCATVKISSTGAIDVLDNAMFNQRASFSGGVSLADAAGNVILYNNANLHTLDISNNPPLIDTGSPLPYLSGGLDTTSAACASVNEFFVAAFDSSNFTSALCYSADGILAISPTDIDYASAPELSFIASGNFLCQGIWVESGNVVAYVTQLLPGPVIGPSYLIGLSVSPSVVSRAVYPAHLLAPLPSACIPLCEDYT